MSIFSPEPLKKILGVSARPCRAQESGIQPELLRNNLPEGLQDQLYTKKGYLNSSLIGALIHRIMDQKTPMERQQLVTKIISNEGLQQPDSWEYLTVYISRLEFFKRKQSKWDERSLKDQIIAAYHEYMQRLARRDQVLSALTAREIPESWMHHEPCTRYVDLGQGTLDEIEQIISQPPVQANQEFQVTNGCRMAGCNHSQQSSCSSGMCANHASMCRDHLCWQHRGFVCV